MNVNTRTNARIHTDWYTHATAYSHYDSRCTQTTHTHKLFHCSKMHNSSPKCFCFQFHWPPPFLCVAKERLRCLSSPGGHNSVAVKKTLLNCTPFYFQKWKKTRGKKHNNNNSRNFLEAFCVWYSLVLRWNVRFGVFKLTLFSKGNYGTEAGCWVCVTCCDAFTLEIAQNYTAT